ncbi:MAG: GTPase Era [Bifidobacteriaceae bacterium]|nr:GTPase Era [Bifidobacteriaceae bacterium]
MNTEETTNKETAGIETQTVESKSKLSTQESILSDHPRPRTTAPDGTPYRFGFVGLVGRPNVGKSTLTNALVGQQVAITSSRPETTRKAIRAIVTLPQAQIVLVDTPGIHRPRTLLGKHLDQVADASLVECDAILFLLPANEDIGPGDRRILTQLHSQFSHRIPLEEARKKDIDTPENPVKPGEPRTVSVWRKPVIAVVTKIDTVQRDHLAAKLLEINQFGHFTQIVPVSAKKSNNIAELENVLISVLPEGPQMYPEDMVSEETPKQRIAELIRGAFLENLRNELPHSLAVVVDALEYPEEGSPSTHARAYVSLYVERESQKPIVIGHKACHLVEVKKKIRNAVNLAVGCPTDLELHVAVAKNWQSDPKKLRRLGF